MPRVLVISLEFVGRGMAGTGIRATELARSLTDVADVTLAAPDSRDAGGLGVPVADWSLRDPRGLWPHIEAADAILCQPQWPHVTGRLVRSGARLIYDLYTPEPLEVLERRPRMRRFVTAVTEDKFGEALRHGHHFLCASEKQRDLWVGAMLGERLLRPSLYDLDSSLDSRIGIVPFGVPAEPPRASPGIGPRASFPQIGGDDEIVIWNGGIWNWFDAPTAIRAVARLAERRPGVRLVFMGKATQLPAQRATEEARRVAGELGLLDSTVLFNDEWVPYDDRGSWLLEADCAVSTHVEHLETRFSFRTRLLDCFWAGLPIVCTRGDDLADRVERDDLGATVAPSDPEALAVALERVLERGRGAYAPGLAAAAADHSWSRVSEPLRRFIAAPMPPRLGRGVPRRPGQVLRNGAFRGALVGLRFAGGRWPRF